MFIVHQAGDNAKFGFSSKILLLTGAPFYLPDAYFEFGSAN